MPYGAVVLAACSGTELALEPEALGHGAFTYALLEGLAGKARRGKPGERQIYVSDLDLYLRERVRELTNGAQTPVVLFDKNRFLNPPLFLAPG